MSVTKLKTDDETLKALLDRAFIVLKAWNVAEEVLKAFGNDSLRVLLYSAHDELFAETGVKPVWYLGDAMTALRERIKQYV
ncbi:hypothetical protein [Chromobacterium amazonense]|uniref:hypothetical protein n=1 Tax=Chromobacterium amazonense TaxID=1382803 RepID=UPI0011B27DD1|nr:hypothetical protein [Chromobacterium amazonense]